MALKDFLNKAKQAVSNVTEAVNTYAANIEAERQKAEEERKAQEERQSALSLPQLPTFTCPHGGCVGSSHLYCACTEQTVCPQGKKTAESITYVEQEALRHIARYYSMPYSERQKFTDECIAEYIAAIYPNLAHLEDDCFRDAIRALLQEEFIQETFYCYFKILGLLNARGNVTEKELYNIQFMSPKENWADNEEKEGVFWSISLLFETYGQRLVADWEFFNRDKKDFTYIIGILATLNDPQKCCEYFPYEEGRVEQLFDENGHVLPSGLDEKDETDTSTIYGLVEYWQSVFGQDGEYDEEE